MKDFFSSNLFYLRTQRRLSQADMLDALGFRRTTWNGYETNKSKPNFDDLLKIARYFGVELSDLVERDLSKGKAIANAAAENIQKAKPTDGTTGKLHTGLATSTELSEPDGPGYNNSANEDLTGQLRALVAELRRDREILVKIAEAATALAQAASTTVADQKAMLEAEITRREGLQRLTLAHLARLSNTTEEALVTEFGRKVAEVSGLRKPEKDH